MDIINLAFDPVAHFFHCCFIDAEQRLDLRFLKHAVPLKETFRLALAVTNQEHDRPEIPPVPGVFMVFHDTDNITGQMPLAGKPAPCLVLVYAQNGPDTFRGGLLIFLRWRVEGSGQFVGKQVCKYR